ncbi:hypothetical protein G5714_002193 [Onychostoma macrolepis]|uniref:Uncharacterized protein n=1 Tax=Onychostoma macrolepis TaxID=369639 RepID=A0A7J6DEI4_9TELE|nr:hypothetical protein G5714_002193 [Onychostoma macrolepis]
MATRSLRVQRLISPQWGQSDPPSAASAWARPRQKTHNSWPSEDSIGSVQERQSRVILVRVRSSPEHSRGREGVSTAACRSQRGNPESSLSESEAHQNTAGEEKACPLQRVDHSE